jgi:hypothetical protein
MNTLTAILLAASLAQAPTQPAAPTPPAESKPAPATPSKPATAPSKPVPAAPPKTSRPAKPVTPPELPEPPTPPQRLIVEDGQSPLRGNWPSKPSGKKVSLDDDEDVDSAVETIAEAAGWELVLNTGRAGNRHLVLNLRDMPVERALEAVLTGTGLAATRSGNVVTVAPIRHVPGFPMAPGRRQAVLSGFDTPSGKKVTLQEAMTLDKALRRIAQAGGFSMTLPPGINREIADVEFKDLPVEEALKALLSQHGLTAKKDGNLVTVSRGRAPSVVIRGGKRRFSFQGPDGKTQQFSFEMDDQGGEAALEELDAELENLDENTRNSIREMKRGLKNNFDIQIDTKGRSRASEKDPNDRVKVRGDVSIGPGEHVDEVAAVLGSVRLAPGAHATEVAAVFGEVDLAPGATIEDDVVAIGGDIRVAPGASIGGNAASIGGEIVVAPGGVIEGDYESIGVPGLKGIAALAAGALGLGSMIASPALLIGSMLAQFALFFALGVLLLLLFPRRIEAVAASMKNAPVRAGLIGLLGFLAQPVLAVLLCITIVGILLIPFQLLALMLAAILGYSALAVFLGRLLPFKIERGENVARLALGTAILVVIYQIPILGFLAGLAAFVVVLGAVIRTRFGQGGADAEPTLPTTPVAPA